MGLWSRGRIQLAVSHGLEISEVPGQTLISAIAMGGRGIRMVLNVVSRCRSLIAAVVLAVVVVVCM